MIRSPLVLVLVVVVVSGCDLGVEEAPDVDELPVGKADDLGAGCIAIAGQPGLCRQGGRAYRRITAAGRVIANEPVDRVGWPAAGRRRRWALPDWELTEFPEELYMGSVCMMNDKVGFVTGSNGFKYITYRTLDGGDSWQISNSRGDVSMGSCAAVDETGLVVVTGAVKVGSVWRGALHWSHDRGDSWSEPQQIPGPEDSWDLLDEVEFGDPSAGFITSGFGPSSWVTDTGGAQMSDWQPVVAGQSWWMGFTFLPDGRLWLAGVGIVHSDDFGHTWRSLPGASPIFDGPIAIASSGFGFTGGGSIAPKVDGWIYRTYDGGQSWSPQPVFAPTVPVRDVALVDDRFAVAAGGDGWSAAGGLLWTTPNGGDTWILEVQTRFEFADIEVVGGPERYTVFATGGRELWRRHVER